MIQSLKDLVNSRSRKEWQEYWYGKFVALRQWIAGHAEKATVLALMIGFLFALFFRYVLTIVIAIALVLYVIWFFAPKDSDKVSKPEDPDSGSV